MSSQEILLTEAQRLEFTEIPQNIDRYEIVKFYTFSNYDIKIINKHRKNYNSLGFSVQLAMIRGLSHLLGFKFAPRSRDISDLKLYCIEKPNCYPKIEGILSSRINFKKIEDNFDDVLRLAYSIKEGKVTASLIIGKLGSYARQNALSTTLQ